jgi:hypothetical protein
MTDQRTYRIKDDALRVLPQWAVGRKIDFCYWLFIVRKFRNFVFGKTGNFSITPGCIGKIPLNPPCKRGKKSECPDLLRSYEDCTEDFRMIERIQKRTGVWKLKR